MLLWHLIVPPECRALHFIRAFPSIAHGNTLKMQHLTHCWGNIAVHFCNSTQPMLLMATRSKCSWIALFSAMNRNTKIAVTRVFHLDCTQKMQNWTVVRVFHFSKCECTPTMPNVRAGSKSKSKSRRPLGSKSKSPHAVLQASKVPNNPLRSVQNWETFAPFDICLGFRKCLTLHQVFNWIWQNFFNYICAAQSFVAGVIFNRVEQLATTGAKKLLPNFSKRTSQEKRRCTGASHWKSLALNLFNLPSWPDHLSEHHAGNRCHTCYISHFSYICSYLIYM